MSQYATPGSAGLDIQAKSDGSINPGERKLVESNLNAPLLKDNQSVYFLVVPRSGLALKHGVTVLNAPGVIDADYSGNIGVILVNHGEEKFEWKKGDRIAQLLAAQMMKLTQFPVGSTQRKGGYGSTGK